MWIHRRDFANQPNPPEDDFNHRRGNPEDYFRFQEEMTEDSLEDPIETRIEVSQPENKVNSKRKDRKGKDAWINIHVAGRFNLCYRGVFKESPVTIMNLEQDPQWIESPESQERSAEILETYFSSVLDDNGNPFIRVRLEANLDSEDENASMVPIEMVGKYYASNLPRPYCLSKNEKLQLGFPVHPNGSFFKPTVMVRGIATPEQADRIHELSQKAILHDWEQHLLHMDFLHQNPDDMLFDDLDANHKYLEKLAARARERVLCRLSKLTKEYGVPVSQSVKRLDKRSSTNETRRTLPNVNITPPSDTTLSTSGTSGLGARADSSHRGVPKPEGALEGPDQADEGTEGRPSISQVKVTPAPSPDLADEDGPASGTRSSKRKAQPLATVNHTESARSSSIYKTSRPRGEADNIRGAPAQRWAPEDDNKDQSDSLNYDIRNSIRKTRSAHDEGKPDTTVMLPPSFHKFGKGRPQRSPTPARSASSSSYECSYSTIGESDVGVKRKATVKREGGGDGNEDLDNDYDDEGGPVVTGSGRPVRRRRFLDDDELMD